MYVEHLVELFREVKRVLKKTGSLWLNIGDTYFGGRGYGDNRSERNFRTKIDYEFRRFLNRSDIVYKSKCLMGLPWRVAFALIDDGWILRNAVIWYKPNHMPSSVKDRLTQTYEYIFHFVKSRKYYYNLDNVREPYKYDGRRQTRYLGGVKDISIGPHERWPHPIGKNPGDLFIIPTKSFSEAHFAVFPIELPLLPILASCPPDGIVLDPLAGSGTVAYTCELINRGMWDEFRLPVNSIARSVKWNLKWIMIDINPEYCKLMEKRLEPLIKQRQLDEYRVDLKLGNH
jgi:site-specific DNA-methyltransferase (cytosine-N4-specific)